MTRARDTANIVDLPDAKGDLFTATAADTPARMAVGNDGEQIVADSSTSTGLRYQATQAAGKNYIINGGMDVWQRGATGLGTSTGSYTADRWVLGSSSTTVTRDTDVPVSPYFQYSMKMVGTGTNSMIQRIESANSVLLAGQTITISFYAKRTSGAGALSLNLYYPSAVDNFTTITQIGSAIVLSASPTSSWVRYQTSVAIGTNITAGLQMLIDNTGASTTFITGVQIEIGSVATQFTRAGGNIQGELAACQRYYQKSYSQGVTVPTNATAAGMVSVASGNLANADLLCKVTLPVVMRTAPTVTIYSYTTSQTGRISAGNGTDLAASSGNTDWIGDSGFKVLNSSGGTVSQASNGFAFHYAVSAEL